MGDVTSACCHPQPELQGLDPEDIIVPKQ